MNLPNPQTKLADQIGLPLPILYYATHESIDEGMICTCGTWKLGPIHIPLYLIINPRDFSRLLTATAGLYRLVHLRDYVPTFPERREL